METPRTDAGHVAGVPLPVITDAIMRERLGAARSYTAVLLRKTAAFKRPDVNPLVWEHGRRNMALAENGVLAVVLPVDGEQDDWAGLAVFAAPPDVVTAIMDSDPGVAAGIFAYEIHPVRGFPGARLPG